MLDAGKSHTQLLEMEAGITSQLERGEAPDPEFMTAVLSRLGLAKARARLRDIHASQLQQHVAALQAAGDPVDLGAAMGWDREKAEQVRERHISLLTCIPLLWAPVCADTGSHYDKAE